MSEKLGGGLLCESDPGLLYVNGTKLCQVIQWEGSVKTLLKKICLKIV